VFRGECLAQFLQRCISRLGHRYVQQLDAPAEYSARFVDVLEIAVHDFSHCVADRPSGSGQRQQGCNTNHVVGDTGIQVELEHLHVRDQVFDIVLRHLVDRHGSVERVIRLVDARNDRAGDAIVIECRVLAAVVVHVAVRLDEFAPADIERFDATLRAPEAIGSMATRTGHCAGGQHRGLVADDGHDIGASRARALEVDLLAADLGFTERLR
jgi:hypothetical protein